MKNIVLSVLVILAASVFSNVFGQRETPAGAGDKSLRDDGIKLRSVEIERIKREADKSNATSVAPINTEIKVKFPQIKEDFESVQILQAAIIKAYTTGKTVDYRLIQTSADGINKKAKRLDTNLFASRSDKQDDKSNAKEEKTKSIRVLIIELDNSIGSFILSKIFGNIYVVDPEVAVKTRTDLAMIRKLSNQLSKEAAKMK